MTDTSKDDWIYDLANAIDGFKEASAYGTDLQYQEARDRVIDLCRLAIRDKKGEE